MNSATPSGPEAAENLEAKAPKGALMTIFSIALVDMLGFGLIIPLLPIYARRFEASPFQVTFLFAIFSICQFAAAPILGGWSDRVGRRPILFLSLVGNAIGYFLLAWATLHQWENLGMGLMTLYVARVIAGLTSGNISAAQAYVSDITTPANRTRGMGILGAAFGIGFSVGPGVGGILAYYVNPSAPAFLAAGLGIIAAGLCQVLLKEVRGHSTTTSNYFRLSRFTPLLANRKLVQITACWFIAMSAFVAADSSIVMLLKDLFEYDLLHITGYFLLVGVIIVITQGGLVGRLSKRYGEWSLCIVGIMLNATGSLLTAGTAWYTHASLLITAAVLYAFGRSLFQPTIAALVSRHSDVDKQGLSIGFFQGAGALGRIVGPMVAGFVYARHITWPWVGGATALWLTSFWLMRVRGAGRSE